MRRVEHRPVVVYAATGYTGRLIAAELVRRGRPASSLEIGADSSLPVTQVVA